jgi:hypothetical protein
LGKGQTEVIYRSSQQPHAVAAEDNQGELKMTKRCNRRRFLTSAIAAGAAAATWRASLTTGAPTVVTTQLKPRGFFTLGQRKGHWWLITPEGKPFFTLGVNHIDPATMRYPENIRLWRENRSLPT